MGIHNLVFKRTFNLRENTLDSNCHFFRCGFEEIRNFYLHILCEIQETSSVAAQKLFLSILDF